MSNLVARFPKLTIAVLIALVLGAHTMAYKDELAQSKAVYIEKTYSLCRLPDVNDEYRMIIQHRIETGRLVEECIVVPRDPAESPAATMDRLLKRQKVTS